MLAIAKQGGFWVGVERERTSHGTFARGQMYVQYQIPAEQRHPFPIVMVHGGGGQGLDFLTTPDGRPGWASWFLAAGYAVYVVDRVGHGRSPSHELQGAMSGPPPYEQMSLLMAGGAPDHAPWPQARLHTQWPGSGQVGEDPALDQFMAGQGPMIADLAATQTHMRRAGEALLKQIGPAILLTHSMGGPFGWIVADACPDKVKAIVAVEPVGPVFDAVAPGMPTLDWGLTAIPLSFDPPLSSAADFKLERRAAPAAGLMDCLVQAGTVRRLPRLAGIPVAVLVAEASFMAGFQHGTVDFLTQAGVTAELLRLEQHGLNGNGHMMMCERNSDAIARFIDSWLIGKQIA